MPKPKKTLLLPELNARIMHSISSDFLKASRAGQLKIARLLERKQGVVRKLSVPEEKPNYLERIMLLEANKKLFRKEEFAELLKPLILGIASRGEINEQRRIVRKYAGLFGQFGELAAEVKELKQKKKR